VLDDVRQPVSVQQALDREPEHRNATTLCVYRATLRLRDRLVVRRHDYQSGRYPRVRRPTFAKENLAGRAQWRRLHH